MRVLFVCTANVCRSPMAAGLFVQAVDDRGISDALAASAGFLESGHPVHEHVLNILEPRGIDMSRKHSQKLNADLVRKADLILTMTSEHARGVVARFPDVIKKVYTFRHFGSIVAPRSYDQTADQWLAHLAASTRRVYLGDDPKLDVVDPIGENFGVFTSLAGELGSTIAWILDCAYPAEVRTG